ncbi:sperm-associated antigen 1-like [Chenopodium quinoa]|uniref:sperm-associated antigen 1-like n=1 Tax=Chenopodium quinoa TaxID=63459 RepID=UPI000B792D37|nr:sperm-associated antigen 1-like [Chenopodium quinoa]
MNSVLLTAHLTGFCGSAKVFFIMVSLFEELRGILCIAHVEKDDISSHKLELLVGKLENPYGILKFVRGLKDEGNAFYKQCNMGLALTKYSLALKLLSFVTVGNDEDKSVFSSLAVSLNLNLGACYVKEEKFDKVGQLCSAVLCYDTSNVKAYFRRAVADLGLNKPELAFMDLAQAIRIDPTNREFQQKLNEVISLLGWSSDFVNEALAVTREDKMFRDYAIIGKEEEKRKCIGVKDVTKKEKDVAGKSLNSEEGKVNPIDQDRRPNIIDNNSDPKSTSETKNPNLTGSITPPVKGHDRCEATPNLAQDDPTTGMVDQVSSSESTSVPLPVAPVYSPLKSAASPNNPSSQNLKLLDEWLKKESVLSYRTPMASE